MTGVTKRNLQDEDYKTAIAQHKPGIPKGVTVRVLDKITNLYGEYYHVEYKGIKYYVPLNGIHVTE